MPLKIVISDKKLNWQIQNKNRIINVNILLNNSSAQSFYIHLKVKIMNSFLKGFNDSLNLSSVSCIEIDVAVPVNINFTTRSSFLGSIKISNKIKLHS
jgi:hypothetical protein